MRSRGSTAGATALLWASWLVLTHFDFGRHGAVSAWPGFAFFVLEWLVPSLAYGVLVRHPAAVLATTFWPAALLVPSGATSTAAASTSPSVAVISSPPTYPF